MIKPKVSTSRCCLRPLPFFPASYPFVSPWVAVLMLCASTPPADGVGWPSLALSLLPGQPVHQGLPDALSTPGVEIAIHRFPATKAGGQPVPWTTGLGDIENPIDDPTPITRGPAWAAGPPFSRRQQRLEQMPLPIGQMRRIFFRPTHCRPFCSGFVVKPEYGRVSTLFSSSFYRPTGFKTAS